MLDNGIEIQCVFTHTDNPNENIWFRSVAELASSKGIELNAPADPNHPLWVERIRKMKPDFIFSFYYRNMLSKELLAIPKKGAINLHGSLLPKYRGRCPINWAVLNGDEWGRYGTFTMFAILFVFIGAQFAGMGLLGEYIGKIHLNARGRPQYYIEKELRDDGPDQETNR